MRSPCPPKRSVGGPPPELFPRLSRAGLGIQHESTLPKKYALHQNYPNPFNPVTTIHYELPKRSDALITIYDLLEKKVTTLLSEIQDTGYKSVIWNVSNVSSGMYFYQMRAGEFLQTKKMILLK
ncbi:MAG: T9SS type A sorting domain-containing protein [Candidatus Marinimicrobia bacterium]|nr:T9SS type A sorting domain-containing protein [Candidatus Neomarinimicrobiota bacterium]MCH7762679.1 T9SS type A sorting domain-containing protein [Candidatus Neomarinimicrobiota bacterium]